MREGDRKKGRWTDGQTDRQTESEREREKYRRTDKARKSAFVWMSIKETGICQKHVLALFLMPPEFQEISEPRLISVDCFSRVSRLRIGPKNLIKNRPLSKIPLRQFRSDS